MVIDENKSAHEENSSNHIRESMYTIVVKLNKYYLYLPNLILPEYIHTPTSVHLQFMTREQACRTVAFCLVIPRDDHVGHLMSEGMGSSVHCVGREEAEITMVGRHKAKMRCLLTPLYNRQKACFYPCRDIFSWSKLWEKAPDTYVRIIRGDRVQKSCRSHFHKQHM